MCITQTNISLKEFELYDDVAQLHNNVFNYFFFSICYEAGKLIWFVWIRIDFFELTKNIQTLTIGDFLGYILKEILWNMSIKFYLCQMTLRKHISRYSTF